MRATFGVPDQNLTQADDCVGYSGGNKLQIGPA
jgi:hypothetical protein